MWRQALLQLKDIMSAAEPGYSIASVFFVAASLILACAEPVAEAPARAPASETAVPMEEEQAEVAPNVQSPPKGVQPGSGTGAVSFRMRDGKTGHAIPANVTLRHVEVDRTGSLVDLSPPSSIDSDEFGRAQFNLPPGEHLIEVSARGYRSVRTHLRVEAGKTPLPGTFEMTPVSTPEELLPEVVEAQMRPDHFLIVGYVVDAHDWQALSGVQLQMSEVRAVTDKKGYFALQVPVPRQDGEASLLEDLVFERSGYKQHVLWNLIYPGGALIIRIEMEPGEGTTVGGTNRWVWGRLAQEDPKRFQELEEKIPSHFREQKEVAHTEAEEPLEEQQPVAPAILEWLNEPPTR